MSINIYMVNHAPWAWNLRSERVIRQFVIGRDDIAGDNITERTDLLEGRFMYWLWKNSHADYVGQQFRRRFLYFRPMFDDNDSYADFNYIADLTPTHSPMIPGERFINYCQYLSEQPDEAFDWLREYDVVTSKKEVYGYPLGTQYCACHRADDWDIFYRLMRAEGFSDEDLLITWLNPSNIWVMRWDLFNEYMDCYWRVFECLTQAITLPTDGYQSRAFGFLTERFFTIWLERKRKQANLNVAYFPILMGDMP